MPNIEIPTPEGFFDTLFAAPEVPEGFYTVVQLAKKYGVCKTTMKDRVSKLVAEGKVACRNYTVKSATTGKLQSLPHYGPPD